MVVYKNDTMSLPPESLNVTLFGKKVFPDVTKLGSLDEMVLDSEWALNPMTSDLKKVTQRGDGDMKIEAMVGVMQPQAREAKGCWKPPEARRGTWI